MTVGTTAGAGLSAAAGAGMVGAAEGSESALESQALAFGNMVNQQQQQLSELSQELQLGNDAAQIKAKG
jgi:hypothetical protein